MRGAVTLRARGLGIPHEVQAAIASCRGEMDALVPFRDEAAAPYAGARVTAYELSEACETWCSANDERARSQKRFAMGLREHGFEGVKGAGGGRCWSSQRPRHLGEPGVTSVARPQRSLLWPAPPQSVRPSASSASRTPSPASEKMLGLPAGNGLGREGRVEGGVDYPHEKEQTATPCTGPT